LAQTLLAGYARGFIRDTEMEIGCEIYFFTFWQIHLLQMGLQVSLKMGELALITLLQLND